MKTERGFTLLETLVALVLLSLLVLALFGGFRAGVSSWQAAEAFIVRTEEPRQLSAMLYRHLRQLKPRATAISPDGRRYSFVGEPNRILYVAPLAMSVDDALYLFELSSGYLGRTGIWTRYMPLSGQLTFAQNTEALKQVEFVQVSADLRLELAYFVSNYWVDTVPVNQLPDLIKVRLLGSEQPWPVLTFAVSERDD